MSKRIILIEGYGQLANRIIQYAHLIAFCKENGFCVYNPDFKKYSSYFKGSFNQKIPFFCENKREDFTFSCFLYYITKVFSKIVKYFSIKNYIIINYKNNNKPFLLNDLLKYPNNDIFIKGWLLRDYDNVKKHYSIITKYFEPIDSYYKEIKDFINTLRKDYDTIVAIHIRRGDYKYYADGKYYFSDQVYCKYLLQLKKLLNDKKVIFVVFSDEKVDIEYYKKEGLNAIQSNSNMIVDLYRMAECDYIIGTVSTFNLWAAYYGKKPHRYIENANDNIKLEDFKIVETL